MTEETNHARNRAPDREGDQMKITAHERNRALSFALSRRCAERINDYWAQHGVAARADVADDGRIVSRVDVTRHIPGSALRAARGQVPHKEHRP